MALERPRGFPESNWPLVVAAEARARTTLLTKLATVPWQTAGYTRFLNWDAVKGFTTDYVSDVVAAFADESVRAVRAGDLAIASLDHLIETFVDAALHYVEFGIDNEKLAATWSRTRHSSLKQEIRPRVMSRPWHLKYLSEVPALVAELTKPQFALSPAAEKRRMVVQPLLEKKGMTPSGLATLAGVDPSVVYDYLHGKSKPRLPNRSALAEALGIPVEQLPE